jgi:hypothetical protein
MYELTNLRIDEVEATEREGAFPLVDADASVQQSVKFVESVKSVKSVNS